MTITTKVEICMGHRLMDYVGSCSSPHGHNYTVEVTLFGAPQPPTGFVEDFKTLRKMLKEILEPFDHAMVLRQDDPLVEALAADEKTRMVVLNVNPTAEYLAVLWFGMMPGNVSTVVVRETEGGMATCFSRHACDPSPRVISVKTREASFLV